MSVIASLLIRVGVSDEAVERGFKNASASVDRFERKINQTSAALNRMGKGITSIGVGPGIVAATGAVVSLVAAAAPAANTILAIPAALAQLGAVAGTVKLGTVGMGDAISAVAEGAEDAKEKLSVLSPEARKVAVVVGEATKSLRKSTQQALFAGWDDEMARLSKDQLPMLQVGFGKVAHSLGNVAAAGLATANTPLVSGAMRGVFDSTAASTNSLADATPGLVKGLASVINTANPLVTTFLDSALAAAAAKGEWLASADGIAWMQEKLAEGKKTLGDLVTIVENLGATILNTFGASRLSAGDLLGRIVEITEEMRRWSESAEGQQKTIEFFDKARTLGTQIAEAFGRVVDVALQLAEGFNALPEPMQSAILTASAYAIVLGPLISRFSSLIALVFQLGGAMLKAGGWVLSFAGKHVLAATKTSAAWISTRLQVLAIWLQLQAAAAASAARTAAAWALMRVQVFAIWVSLQAQAMAASARIAAAWIASWVAQSAAATANMVRTGITVAGTWAMMAAQSLIQAARMAAAWVIAMGPVGWVIAAIIALVVLIIMYWDEIVAYTKKAWDWIYSRAIKPAIDLVVAAVKMWVDHVMSIITFVFSTIPQKLREWWNAGYNAVVDATGRILTLVRELPGKVWDAIGSMNDKARQWGRDLIQGIINGIGDLVGQLTQKARDAATSAMNAIKSALGVNSPSKITHKYMIWVGEGGIGGLDKITPALVAASEKAADATMAPWDAFGQTRPFTIDDAVRAPLRPSTMPPDDPRGGPDEFRGRGDAPLVSIGTFNAGGMTPGEVATELEWKARQR